MEFEEVNNFIRTDQGRSQQQQTTFEPYHPTITRKPTLSNFVHRLKQHSSKTRFISQYKKMSVTDSVPSDDDGLSDDGKRAIFKMI